jgi:hypothetical protein
MNALSPGCLLGSVLSVAALLADPDGAPQRAADTARTHLAALKTLGQIAVALDAGPAPLRWLFGVRPAREIASEILGDGAADIDRQMAVVAALLPALRAAKRPEPPAVTSLTEAVASRVVEAIRGPDRTVPPEAARVLARLDHLQDAVAGVRSRLIGLVLGLGSLRWLEGLTAGLAIRVWVRHRIPSRPPAAARPLTPSKAGGARRQWRNGRPPRDPISRALVTAGAPVALAGEIAGHFGATPDWPGSLHGHDREPGGLGRHTERVLTLMAEASTDWPPEARMAAAVVAAAHDLGKLVAYRRVGPDRWVGFGTTPHDCLSAMLLARCPSWRSFASPEIRAGILQVLAVQHAPEGLSDNATPLARQLLTTLAEADTAAARTSRAPGAGTEEGPSDAA